MDSATAKGTNLAHTSVCIEVSPNCDFPKALTFNSPFGYVIKKVEYEWGPKLCKPCKYFTHSELDCPTMPKVRKIWVVKKHDTGQQESPTIDSNVNCVEPVPQKIAPYSKLMTSGEVFTIAVHKKNNSKVQQPLLITTIAPQIPKNHFNPSSNRFMYLENLDESAVSDDLDGIPMYLSSVLKIKIGIMELR